MQGEGEDHPCSGGGLLSAEHEFFADYAAITYHPCGGGGLLLAEHESFADDNDAVME